MFRVASTASDRFIQSALSLLGPVCYADPQLGEVVASVYEKTYKSEPDDNVFTSQATLKAFGKKGFKKSEDGGRLIECDIEYAENTTMQMVGEMDVLDTTRIRVFDCARYEWKICAGTVVYSHLEAARARGDSAKFAVIEKKIENGRKSHFAKLNRQLWSTSVGSNDIISLPTIISTTPTTGTVGGINAATFSFWRNRANEGTKTTNAFDDLVAAMRLTWNQCSLGGVTMTPTALVGTQAAFEGYEQTQQTLLRYVFEDSPGALDAGFANKAIAYKGTPFFYDEDVQDTAVSTAGGAIYMLNNEILKFEYLSGFWAKLLAAVEPADQLANIHRMETFGNTACGARRHLGVVYDIT